jgi:hypothetical protein
MSLQDTIYALIKDEIAKDPQKIGYAGKTDDEIAVLLNTNPVRISSMANIDVPPISRILQGVPMAPNLVTKDEVISAQSII